MRVRGMKRGLKPPHFPDFSVIPCMQRLKDSRGNRY